MTQCPHCRQASTDVARLRRLLLERDAEILRLHQQTAAHHEEMMRHLERLAESQALLKRELDARPM